ncbi:MAG: hypothetical protein ACF8OB_01695 [Phycisphaeraceae bacterium JB051]
MSAFSLSNIVYVMCDELRCSEVACCGHPHIKTANMDQIITDFCRNTPRLDLPAFSFGSQFG